MGWELEIRKGLPALSKVIYTEAGGGIE
ncbi:MAG: hypothetical protein K0S75_1983, partial [Clostridia bacterium]|nr:hypothetical protein [Clostridia bacterium]